MSCPRETCGGLSFDLFGSKNHCDRSHQSISNDIYTVPLCASLSMATDPWLYLRGRNGAHRAPSLRSFGWLALASHKSKLTSLLAEIPAKEPSGVLKADHKCLKGLLCKIHSRWDAALSPSPNAEVRLIMWCWWVGVQRCLGVSTWSIECVSPGLLI